MTATTSTAVALGVRAERKGDRRGALSGELDRGRHRAPRQGNRHGAPEVTGVRDDRGHVGGGAVDSGVENRFESRGGRGGRGGRDGSHHGRRERVAPDRSGGATGVERLVEEDVVRREHPQARRGAGLQRSHDAKNVVGTDHHVAANAVELDRDRGPGGCTNRDRDARVVAFHERVDLDLWGRFGIDRIGIGVHRIGIGVHRIGIGIDRIGIGVHRIGIRIDRIGIGVAGVGQRGQPHASDHHRVVGRGVPQQMGHGDVPGRRGKVDHEPVDMAGRRRAVDEVGGRPDRRRRADGDDHLLVGLVGELATVVGVPDTDRHLVASGRDLGRKGDRHRVREVTVEAVEVRVEVGDDVALAVPTAGSRRTIESEHEPQREDGGSDQECAAASDHRVLPYSTETLALWITREGDGWAVGARAQRRTKPAASVSAPTSSTMFSTVMFSTALSPFEAAAVDTSLSSATSTVTVSPST